MRSRNGFVLLRVGAIALLLWQPVRAQPPSEGGGIDTSGAFAELLSAVAESDPQARVALLSKAADLEERDLRHLTAHNPTAFFRSQALPNSIGLVSLDYGIEPSWVDPERSISSVRFNFVERDASPESCAQFAAARAALGLPADTEPTRVPTAIPDLHYRQRDERKNAHANAGVATNGLVAPCLRAAWTRFHQAPRSGQSGQDQR